MMIEPDLSRAIIALLILGALAVISAMLIFDQLLKTADSRRALAEANGLSAEPGEKELAPRV